MYGYERLKLSFVTVGYEGRRDAVEFRTDAATFGLLISNESKTYEVKCQRDSGHEGRAAYIPGVRTASATVLGSIREIRYQHVPRCVTVQTVLLSCPPSPISYTRRTVNDEKAMHHIPSGQSELSCKFLTIERRRRQIQSSIC